jgi:hypothetical protein
MVRCALDMPSESEILAARLARIKHLLDSLETACATSAKIQETFATLHSEMDAARDTVDGMRERRSGRDRRRLARNRFDRRVRL